MGLKPAEWTIMQQTQPLDLAKELSAKAEAIRNEASDAVEFDGSAMRVDAHVDRVPRSKQAQLRKVSALVKRGLKLTAEGDHAQAAKLGLRAVELAPDLALTNHFLGLCLYKLGRLSRALDFFERAWKIDPNDPEIYEKMGLVAWKLDMLEVAEKFYRLQLKGTPNSLNGTINLAGVLRDQGKFDVAIELLRAAIYANPENYDLWNSLGTALTEKGDQEEAETFYLEALRLKPDFGRAHNNLANVYELQCQPEKAIGHFEEALKDPSDPQEAAAMRHGRSMVLLAAGHLKDGWEAYDSRLDPTRTKATIFSIDLPRWNGLDVEEIRGKTVLFVGEQGLGDEVLFMNVVKDLEEAIGPEGQLRIVCEKRLQPLVRRSFPKAEVFPHTTLSIEGRELRALPDAQKGADIWCAMATPMAAFRTSLEDFPDEPGYLVADPEAKAAFREQIDGFGDGLKVGILWKSLKMDPKRSRFFSAFDAWEGVLKTPGCDFINLQYGDVEDEIALAEERFGVPVHMPQGIDLRQELDKVAALSSSCDLVIGPMNATSNLAAACGGKVWFVHARSSAWTLLGTGRQLWYPQSRSFFGEGFQDWGNTMRKVETALAEEVAARS